MPRAIRMHEVNCRVVGETNDWVTLQVSNRRTAVVLPKSWISLRRRRPNPLDARNAASVKKYPMALRIPLALAQQKGLA